MAFGDVDSVRVSRESLVAHPKQTSRFRWGPHWDDGARNGGWLVDRIYNVAVRVVFDEAAELVEAAKFDGWVTRRVEDVRYTGADAQLKRLTRRRRSPKLNAVRDRVTAGTIGGPTDGARVEDFLV